VTSSVARPTASAAVCRTIGERLSLNVAAQTFYRNLTATVAHLTRARRVVFLQLADGYLNGVRDAFGFGASDVADVVVACGSAGRRGGVEYAVYEGQALTERRVSSSGSTRVFMDALSATDVAAVGWRTGNRPLGILAACNSAGGDGFTDDDLSVLEAAGMSASLAWEHHRTVTALNSEIRDAQQRLALQAVDLQREHHVRVDLLTLATAEMGMALRSMDPRAPVVDLLPRLDNMTMAIAGLRNPNHIPGSSLRLTREQLSMNEFISSVIGSLQTLGATPGGIKSSVHSTLTLWADRRALTSILVTMIYAAQHDGRSAKTVEVECTHVGGMAHLKVHAGGRSEVLKLTQATEKNIAHCRLLARMHGGDLVINQSGYSDFPLTLTIPTTVTDHTPPAVLLSGAIRGRECEIRVYEELQTVERQGRRIRLSWTEWRLFSFLWRHPNTVFSRKELAIGAWGDSLRQRDQLVDVNIARIRSKIERNPRQPSLLHTVRKRGYEFRTSNPV
jgi:hypothetical protein